ncbi:hypothetical protein AX15_006131 [Amanita polypyramis BW_CC]|nr:hypothetical protein AX15_006131 [Amanita polypyramis BW_CC]
MNGKSKGGTHRTATRSNPIPKIYRDDSSDVIVVVTRSATGKGIHKRWEYPKSSLSVRRILPGEEKLSTPLTRELTINANGVFAQFLNAPPSSIGPTSSNNNDSNSLTPPLEGPVTSSPQTGDRDKGETPGTREASSPAVDLPRHMVFRPDRFDKLAVMKRMMKEEERIEETYRNQWQKMLEERRTARRIVKRWGRQKKRKAKHNRRTDSSSESGEENSIECASDAEAAGEGSTPGSQPNSGRKKECPNVPVTPRRRPLQRCATVFIEPPSNHD